MRLGQVSSGSDRLGHDNLGYVRSELVRSGYFRLCQSWSGYVRFVGFMLCYFILDHVRSG